ncbi:MAG: hypothetical protein QG574_5243 [Cyanobacteriota bacterium erpe_2018_sw_21hr_WHONDRS-SW48-000092_B_bin.40]|nr:hypothetical protein [Cyanobacteriota bacterium erpe_2018_sw_21hr_WHONDRS-SW48-000092_B_bin.40]
MTKTIEKSPVQDRFQHLLAVISSERFLKKEGLGNEVPFFICPYRPEEAVEMGRIQKQLVNKLQQLGTLVLEINLYDLSIKLLKERNVWDRIIQSEPEIAKDQLKELLQGTLDSRAHLIPAIAKEMNATNFDVMFITGVGEVFPYIRSHNVLNNLQSTAKDKPTVMFFPGAYTHSLQDGASLDLFGRLHDDKYYRAFNIFHCEV